MRTAFAALLLIPVLAAAQPSLRERMLAAEDQRAATEAELAPLRQGLGSRDPRERRQAVRAFGRLEQPEHMPLVSRLLTDPDVDVRAEAVNAIGQMARGPEGVAGAKSRLLVRLKAEQHPRVSGVVAATLGRLPFTSAADVQQAERAIVAMLPAAPPAAQGAVRVGPGGAAGPVTTVQLDVVAGAAEGLKALIRQSGKLSAPAADTIARLRALSAMEGRTEDAAVLARIRRLARLALNAAGIVDRDLLESGLSDRDHDVRRLTMIAARATTDGQDAAVRQGLADANPQVRYEALQTWGRHLQKTSCAPVLAAVADANPHVSLLAIDLLSQTCPEQDEADRILHAIATRLQTEAGTADPRGAPTSPTRPTSADATWHAPAHAMVSLAKIAPDKARGLLPGYMAHPTWQVRMYAAHAAGALASTGDLEALGRDDHDNVREAALGHLIVLRRPEAIPLALEGLKRTDYQLVMTAARALGVPAAREQAIPALFEAMTRITAEGRDTSRDPRLAILARIEELGWPDGSPPGVLEQRAVLESHLEDFDPAVAARVAEMLEHWAQRAFAATPKPRRVTPPSWSDVERLAHARLRVTMRGKGTFDLRLLVDEAPLSAYRLATRAREGYYDGLTFHRVVPNFVIQGGSPGANEYAGDAAYMRDEVGLVSHRRGTVGISTRGRDTGDAQIFVNLVDLPRLDHTYTVVAEVERGMDVVDAILEGDVIERVDLVASGTR